MSEDFSLAGSGSSQGDGTANGGQAGSGALGSGSAGFNTAPDGRRDGNTGGGSAGTSIGTAGVAGGDSPRRADGTVPPPPPPPPNGGRGDANGRSSGGAGAGGANVGTAGSPAPVAGASGSGPSIGHQILNPQDCHSDRPFVLTIEPSGDRGSVSGWLESAPQLAFKDQLPRFDNAPDPDLALWWSIASLGPDSGPSLYFYGENDATRVAVANGARAFDEIDSGRLVFDDWVTPMVGLGAIVVFENVDTKERVAMRVDDILDSDPDGNMSGTCAALTASWTFDF